MAGKPFVSDSMPELAIADDYSCDEVAAMSSGTDEWPLAKRHAAGKTQDGCLPVKHPTGRQRGLSRARKAASREARSRSAGAAA